MRAIGVATEATTSKAVSVHFVGDELVTIEIPETGRVNGSTIPKADQRSLSINGLSPRMKIYLLERACELFLHSSIGPSDRFGRSSSSYAMLGLVFR